MSDLAYIVDPEADVSEGGLRVVVIRSGIAVCGPAFVMDFARHRNRIERFWHIPNASPPPGFWFVHALRTAGLPDDYVMLWDGTQFLVLDGNGQIIAGPDTDWRVLTDAAWEHVDGHGSAWAR